MILPTVKIFGKFILSNAVFENSPVSDPSKLGKIGFVDVDGKLNEHPSSLIGYDNTYVEQSGYNVDSNDLGTQTVDSVEHCKTYCNSKSNCVGFTFISLSWRDIYNFDGERFNFVGKSRREIKL